ncbi:MAG: NUDIX hydrolase [Lachnospiraceae bacterium]|nr:NUDIX hydrolase [Lachnospiraceae bacterium]
MAIIKNIRQETNHRFLNFFTLDAVNKAGNPKEYYVASRAGTIDELKIRTRVNKPDGVTVYALYGEKKDKVVLVKQYRYPVDHFVYELPSGIVDEGETYREAAVREMMEETGLAFRPIDADPAFEMPRFQTVGMTDESCAMVFGYADGVPTSAGEEEGEEIEVVIADREEIKRILREEYMASVCAYQLSHFLADEDPFAFLRALDE